MRKFRVIGFKADFHSGKIELSKEQALPRMHNLKHIKGDIYEIVKPIQFKAGELIGFDGEVSKSMLGDIGEVKSPLERQREK